MASFICYLLVALSFSGNAQTWAVYNTTNSPLVNDFITRLFCKNQSDVWVSTTTGFSNFDGSNWFNNSNLGIPTYSINEIKRDYNNNFWIGTWWYGVVKKYPNNNWVTFTTSNSGLPNDLVRCITVDSFNNVWFGTGDGLAKFDGANWTIYNTSNSGLQNNDIMAIQFDSNGNLWIAPNGTSLTMFNGSNWFYYNTSNIGISLNRVREIQIDNQNNLWFCSDSSGLTKFDGSIWSNFNPSNSPIPSGTILSVSFESNGNKWIGTANGLAKYDNFNWTIYNTTNSSLPDNQVNAVAVNISDDIYIGTINGLAKLSGTAANYGSLHVSIYPSAANSAGALWQLDGAGNWYSSGTTLNNIPVGNHTVNFNSIAGWTSPSNQLINITNGNTSNASGTYVQSPQYGSVYVSISPSAANSAGALWQLDGAGNWYSSGTTLNNIPVGNHTVNFNSIAGWTSPSNQLINVTNGNTSNASGTYVQSPQYGSVYVSISPSAANSAGALWQLDGAGNWYSSGTTLNNIPVGNHTVNFNSIAGWTSPSNQLINVTNGNTSNASGTYVQISNPSSVTISNVIHNNSTFPLPRILWSGTTNQTASTIKICADASKATEITFVNNTGIPTTNIRFWIGSDTLGVNSDVSGYFVFTHYQFNGTTVSAKLTHPKYLQSSFAPFRADNIRIVDYTNSYPSIFTIPFKFLEHL
ncbi:MAG: hypothetical protein IPJ79_18765 [Bacteroidetes bacterium]|nr:hypothetical protein [Bacteroidota bacterium]